MTDIDPQADIELHSADGHVTVGVPLAGAVTDEWLRCYRKLALETKVPVRAQARRDQAKRPGASRGPVAGPGIARAAAAPETRWPMACTLVVAMAVPVLLNHASWLRRRSPTSPSPPSSTPGRLGQGLPAAGRVHAE
jgi:hypothetical protein